MTTFLVRPESGHSNLTQALRLVQSGLLFALTIACVLLARGKLAHAQPAGGQQAATAPDSSETDSAQAQQQSIGSQGQGQENGAAASNPSINLDQPSQLARGSYRDRQRATLEMWRGRNQSRQAVQDATRNPDPEISERAEWILRQWRSGIIPGVGGDQDGLFHRDGPTALAAVLESGAFDAALIAVEESAGTIEYDQVKAQMATMLVDRYPFYTDKAYSEGTLPDLLRLIDSVAVDRELATCARDLRSFLGHSKQALDALPASAEKWDPAEREIYRATIASLNGNHRKAIEAANRTDDPILQRIALMVAGRWLEIAQRSEQELDSSSERAVQIESATWLLAAAHRLDDRQRFQKARDILLQVNEDDDESLRDLSWRALAIHGDVDAAIDLIAMQDLAAAAKVACVSSRFQRAASLCGYKLESIDSDLNSWIKDAFREQASKQYPAGQIAPSMERLYSLARLLLNVGDSANAETIYRRLTPRQIIVSKYGYSLRDQTLRELARVNRYEWMMDIAVSQGENSISRRTRAIIADALGMDYEAFGTLIDRCSIFAKRGDYRNQFRIAFQLARGEIPPGFRPSRDFQRLYEAIVHHQPLQSASQLRQSKEIFLLHVDLVDLFVRHGQNRIAREAMELLCRRGDLDAMISAAESDLEQGAPAKAEGQWHQVAQVVMQTKSGAKGVPAEIGIAYAKSIVGHWILAKRSGYRETAGQLENRVRLMLTSPSLAFRKDLADYLREFGQYPLAIETLKELVILSAFGGGEAPDFFRAAVAYVGAIEQMKESDPNGFAALQLDSKESVRWSDLAIFGIIKSSIYYDTAFISVPLSVQKTFLQHAIDRRDSELANQAIRGIQSLDPLNIDFGERMLPSLREAGMVKIADQAFDDLMDSGEKHLQVFRMDATARNNLAWTAAMNERRLDRALQLSEMAVMMEPDSVIYRDTLAEILHLQGNTREALAIESACLLDQPDEWHLHEQIKKYREILDADAGE